MNDVGFSKELPFNGLQAQPRAEAVADVLRDKDKLFLLSFLGTFGPLARHTIGVQLESSEADAVLEDLVRSGFLQIESESIRLTGRGMSLVSELGLLDKADIRLIPDHEPLVMVSVEPKTPEGQEKLQEALGKVSHEDPTLRLASDPETGQTVVFGMGESHIKILVERLRQEHGIETNVGELQVAYREAITESARAEGRFIRQSSGHGVYGHCWITVKPLEMGTGVKFVNSLNPGVVPEEFLKSIEAGVRESLQGGVVAGYPMIDVEVTINDGSFHPVDSSEMAFKTAASMATKAALRQAKPTILEPIMRVQVIAPGQSLGDILADLNGRRGQIHNIEAQGDAQVTTAHVPLSEIFGYGAIVQALSRGRATYAMEFDHYAEVPTEIAQEISLKESVARAN